jgi:hypothetical protein
MSLVVIGRSGWAVLRVTDESSELALVQPLWALLRAEITRSL